MTLLILFFNKIVRKILTKEGEKIYIYVHSRSTLKSRVKRKGKKEKINV